MTCLRIASSTVLLATCIACAPLNYPGSGPKLPPPSAPVLLEPAFGVPETASATETADKALSWNELTRLARANRQKGEMAKARERLAQAAEQLADRPASDASRRAVFGMRARLAIDFASLEQFEEADEFADLLFEQARQEPALGSPALVDLATRTATRRKADAKEAGLNESQLPLYRLALSSAEMGAPSQNRIELAYQVALEASRENDLRLARNAIDRGVLDAEIVAPNDDNQTGTLKILKSRIALRQGDHDTSVAAATAAYTLFDDAGFASAHMAMAESALAQAIAGSGDIERARAVAVGAVARLEDETPPPDHVRRTILGAMAFVEMTGGNKEAARERYRQALDIPESDFDLDRHLVEQLNRELMMLDGDTAVRTPEGESESSDPTDEELDSDTAAELGSLTNG